MGAQPAPIPQERMAMTHRDQLHQPTPELVIAALESARTLVEQGHCKGMAYTVVDDAACFCAMGALAKVCETVVLWTDAEGRRAIVPGSEIFISACRCLKIMLHPRWESVTDFNDLSSQDAVVCLFTRAIGIVGQVVAA